MQHWNELRTAHAVATHGTVLHAAQALGVHRATVVRHVDTLESALGVPLFYRHRQGYELTDAGRDLLAVTQTADDAFREMAGRLRGREAALSGELTLTSLPLLSPLMIDAIASFRRAHPGVQVRYQADERVLRQDHGEAHISLRMGAKPDHPDAVVQAYPPLQSGLYASPAYLQAHPTRTLADHTYVHHAPLEAATGWLAAAVPDATLGLTCNDARSVLHALRAGLGVGFCPVFYATQAGLEPVRTSDTWNVPTWLVTHIASHRSTKVRQMAAHIHTVVREALAG